MTWNRNGNNEHTGSMAEHFLGQMEMTQFTKSLQTPENRSQEGGAWVRCKIWLKGDRRSPITPPCFRFLPLHQLKPLIMSVVFFLSGFFRLIKTWKQNGQEDMFCSSAGCSALWGQQCGGLYLNCMDMNSITEACCSQEGNPDTCIPLWCLLKRAALDLPHAQGMACNPWEACSPCEACPFLSHLHTPFIKDSLLFSECLASLSWVFIREFNRQASFTKTPYKKNLENASLCLQKYARLTVWPCGIKNEWTKPLILRNNVCICNLASILLGASVTLEFLIKKIYIVSES